LTIRKTFVYLHIFIKQRMRIHNNKKLETMMTTKTYTKQYQPKGQGPQGTTGYVKKSDLTTI
jgi:hypothetical protein